MLLSFIALNRELAVHIRALMGFITSHTEYMVVLKKRVPYLACLLLLWALPWYKTTAGNGRKLSMWCRDLECMEFTTTFTICLYWKMFRYRYNFEEFYLLGYNAVWCVESQPTFRGHISSPSSGSKIKPSKKPARKQVTSFDPKDGGDVILRNMY
jgi:hypothetical protein